MEQREIARRLEQVRERVRKELASAQPISIADALPPEKALELGALEYEYKLPDTPNLNTTAHLESANDLAAIAEPVQLTSRVPVLGPLLTLVRRLTRPFVQPLLDPYIERQERFNVEIVRHLNELGQMLEARLENISAQLEHWLANPGHVEARLDQALETYDEALRQRHVVLFDAFEEELLSIKNRILDGQEESSRRLSDFEVRFVERSQAVDRRFDEKDEAMSEATGSVDVTIRGLERSQETLGEQLHAADVRQDGLERRQDDLERIQQEFEEAMRSRTGDSFYAEMMETRSHLARTLAQLEKTHDLPTAADGAGGEVSASVPGIDDHLWKVLREWMNDADYRAFQDQFRGDEKEIARRLKAHVAKFDGMKGPVVDLGCGRGEFLELLEESGHTAIGVELNIAEVETCTKRGLTAIHADLFDWLDDQEPESLGGIFMAQVIEHLPPPDWSRFVQLAVSRLGFGGRLIIETINPESLYALARAYVVDPTHIRPVHPRLLAFFAERAGFETTEIRYQAEVPANERALPIDTSDYADRPEMLALLEEVNLRFQRLDRLCCAPQEYTLVATRRNEPLSES